jgi:hypothetical protein
MCSLHDETDRQKCSKYISIAWYCQTNKSNDKYKHYHTFIFLSNSYNNCLIISLLKQLPYLIRKNIIEFIGEYHTKNIAYEILMFRHAIVFTPPNIISYYKYMRFDVSKKNKHNIKKIHYTQDYTSKSSYFFSIATMLPNYNLNIETDDKVNFWNNNFFNKEIKITFNSQRFFRDSIKLSSSFYHHIINDQNEYKWILTHYDTSIFEFKITLPDKIILIIIEYALDPYYYSKLNISLVGTLPFFNTLESYSGLNNTVNEYIKYPINYIYLYEPFIGNQKWIDELYARNYTFLKINRNFSAYQQLFSAHVYPKIKAPEIMSCKSSFKNFMDVYKKSVKDYDICSDSDESDVFEEEEIDLD